MQLLYFSPREGRRAIKKVLEKHDRNPHFQWRIWEINVWAIRQAILKKQWILKRWGQGTLYHLREIQKERIAALTPKAGKSRDCKIVKLNSHAPRSLPLDYAKPQA